MLDVVPARWRLDEPNVTTVRRGPLVVVDLLHVYRSFVPDLTFRVDHEFHDASTSIVAWSAEGRHVGRALGVTPTARRVRLKGFLKATLSRTARARQLHGTWDTGGFLKQIDISRTQFEHLLDLPRDTVRVRAIETTRGVPAVLVPTMTLPGWTTWSKLTAALARSKPVVNLQLVANRRGLERDVNGIYDLKTETRAVRAALDDAGIEGPFDLVGHSAGGTVALDFTLDYPSDVRSLTLIEPGPAWVLKAAGPLSNEIKEFLDDQMASYTGPLTTRAYVGLFRRLGVLPADFDPHQSPVWPLFFAYMHNVRLRPALYTHTDHLERLHSADVPVLLVSGRRTHAFYREIARALRRLLPRVRAVTMRGGHAPHEGTGAVPFRKRLLAFYRELDRTRPLEGTAFPDAEYVASGI